MLQFGRHASHPRDVDSYLSDSWPDAYERLVDRLLASPHFGERMAMFWIDLLRSADTTGYHGTTTSISTSAATT